MLKDVQNLSSSNLHMLNDPAHTVAKKAASAGVKQAWEGACQKARLLAFPPTTFAPSQPCKIRQRFIFNWEVFDFFELD
jgi:hypothetical protein